MSVHPITIRQIMVSVFVADFFLSSRYFYIQEPLFVHYYLQNAIDVHALYVTTIMFGVVMHILYTHKLFAHSPNLSIEFIILYQHMHRCEHQWLQAQ